MINFSKDTLDITFEITEYVDVFAPEAPTGLFATTSDNTITLAWALNDPEDVVVGYNLYLVGFLHNTALIKDNEIPYAIDGLINLQDYPFYITAVDQEGNESKPSKAITATPVDKQPPPPPTGLRVTGFTKDTIQVSLNYPTNPELSGFNIYVDGVKNNSTTQTNINYTINNTALGQLYHIYATFVDNDGNESNASTILSYTTPAWPFYATYTVPAGKATDTITNIPVALMLGDLPTEAWDYISADGGNIRITDGNRQLSREIGTIDTANKKGVIWVKTALSPTSATKLRLYLGNPSASDYAVIDPHGRNAVWSNDYMAVYHLNEAAAMDSTGKNLPATPVGGPTVVDSPLGKALDFDGVDDILHLGDICPSPISGTTVFCKLKVNAPYTKDNYIYDFFDHDLFLRRLKSNTSSPVMIYAPATYAEIGEWINFYTTPSATLSGSSFSLGGIAVYYPALSAAITVDELHLSSIQRNQAWQDVVKLMLDDPSGFYSVGSLETNTDEVSFPTS